MVAQKKGRKKVAIETLEIANEQTPPENATVKHQPDPNNILEFQIKNGLQFKNIFDIVKDVNSDTCLSFTPEGMKLTTPNDNDEEKLNVIVYVNLEPQYFEYYHCNVDYWPVGVDLIKFRSQISQVQTGWTIRWKISKDEPTRICLSLKGGGNDVEDSFNDKVIDPYVFSDGSLEYDFPPMIPSNQFRLICKKLHDIKLKEVRIIIDGETVIFKSTKTNFSWKIDCETGDNPEDIDSTEVAEGVFNVAPLKNFAKPANVSTNVKLYLQTGSPLICEYELHSNGIMAGTLKYLIFQNDF